ncbi:proline-specific peptidase [Laetiporus sulphureus 93-53]|uniref:Proline-specific peptidase n=1 Tax=Laetiporus sulphureus 93-53 TaxID=1314785 RepID=A0A165CNG2_9APHY|nr:proline-specific peptidase [Laetiporus sulphureus 93-53]KZT03129.1 proline-specific peptidase [Laetiporus sulphureus 93-53]
MSEITGTIPFVYGGETYHTWYKVAGDLQSGVRPLIALHGGPGISHRYMLPHASLSKSHNIPVIFYDQIGIGQSSHPKDKSKEFWSVDLFMDELDNLLDHFKIRDNFDLLGHSWGGMLAAHYAGYRRPSGMKHLIIGNASASMEEMLRRHEREGTTDSKEYQEGMQVFYQKHVCAMNPWPELLLESFAAMSEDPTVYSTMIGPSEFNIVGTLRTWSCIDQLHNIAASTLLINAEEDEAQDINFIPIFQSVSRVKWVQLTHCTHIPFFEAPGRYFEILSDFLLNV